jgi:hypothetical protein
MPAMLRRLILALRWRRPTAIVAAGSLLLQVFLSGLAIAQATNVSAASPADLTIICHGHGGSDDGGAPQPATTAHPCCLACAAGPVSALPQPPACARLEVAASVPLLTSVAVGTRTVPRAVRDGLSQAPPTLA